MLQFLLMKRGFCSFFILSYFDNVILNKTFIRKMGEWLSGQSLPFPRFHYDAIAVEFMLLEVYGIIAC
jgi:hypothetical protein